MKTALVTGASSGLGVDFAHAFAKDQYSLILVARRKDLLKEVASNILKMYPTIRVDIIDCDLSLPDAGQTLFSKVAALGLQVDYLVNNAGVGSSGEFKNLPLKKEMQMIDLNIRTLVELTHLFLPPMLFRKTGGILNVASTAGFQPGPYMATYYASKAFVLSFSEALYEELKGSGVTCTVLAPGATATEFSKVSGNDNSPLFKSTNVARSKDVALVGYRALRSGKSLAIAGLINNIMVQALRFSPRFMIRKIAAYLNKGP